MQRYNHTAESLGDTLSQGVINSCRAHPKTQFIFNSVLLTKFDNLNKEILKFNSFMRDVCSRVANLNYFDSHNVLITSGIRNVINSTGNGIHITFEARKTVTKSLAKSTNRLVVNAVLQLVTMLLFMAPEVNFKLPLADFVNS